MRSKESLNRAIFSKKETKKRKEKIPQTEEKGAIFISPDQQQQLDQIKHRLNEMKETRYNPDKWNNLTLEQMQAFAEEVKELRKQRDRIEKGTTETTITAINKETNQEIEINLETERIRWQTFFENHNFKDKVDIPELTLNEEQIKEIQILIEQGFVDKCAVIPDHLIYQELEPEMAKAYEKTGTGSNFDSDGGFDELDKQETPRQSSGQANQQYRLIFYKKVQNLEDDKILKATKGKSPDQIDKYIEQINKQHNTDIQGISLKDYLIIQREFTETINTDKNIQDKSRHMDEQGWSWCLKSRFKKSGRVVDASWFPGDRQLLVNADDSSYSYSIHGSRLSRSFPA